MKKRTKAAFLTSEEVSFFCDQVALMLESGISLNNGMSILRDNYQKTPYAKAFWTLNALMEDGSSLCDAMTASGIFPPYAIRMTRIGESAGKSEEVMRGLSAYYARESKTARAIRGAIYYPLALMVIMAAVIAILEIRVLPLFDRVFKSLGADLSETSGVWMNVGAVLGKIVLALIGVILLAALIALIVRKSGKGQKLTVFLCRIFPALGKIRAMTSAGRFASVLSILLSAGFPASDAIRMAVENLDDEAARQKVSGIVRAVEEENAELSSAIEASGIFEPMRARMLQIGFMTGKTYTVMESIASLYEEELDDGIHHLVAVVEPALVSVLAVIIGGILLTVMLPLAGIMASFI